MNRFSKIILASLMGVNLLVGQALAQEPAAPEQEACSTAGATVPTVDLVSQKACYLPEQGMFVVIDSIDCAVDILAPGENGELSRVGRYVTDSVKRRHDLVNIVRPVSVGIIGHSIVFLASSAKDSSYFGVLDIEGNLVNHVGFHANANAFTFNQDKMQVIVWGRNQVGYDIQTIDLSQLEGCPNGRLRAMSTDNVVSFHYHVPKQSERIKEADPVGIGLTVVAVAVVFLALLFISLILKGYGNVIIRTQDKKAKKSAAKDNSVVASPSSAKTAGEVYAAIATAIYLYDEEMHDEEDTVITIQKVERAWTPWNAKFYNMNHYFNR